MKKTYSLLLLFVGILFLTSCKKDQTYSDLKEAERDAINHFIENNGIKVIGEAQFINQGETTNLDRNEFVLLERSAVYMQIVRKGTGSKIKDKEQVEILCRFLELNIKTDSLLVRNDIYYGGYINNVFYDFSQSPEKMSVQRSGSTYTASFVQDNSWMYILHGSSTVPAGWLVPLSYINLGRLVNEDDEIAKVRLIVPHSQGTVDASAGVYPCYYEITYERDI